MARRLDIELTSARPDGTWTWRAAGAREPRGVLDGALLPDGGAVGAVLRVDADITVDGIEVTAVLPSKEVRVPRAQTLELLGSGREEPLVTSSLVPGGRGARDGDGRSGRDRRPPGRERSNRERPSRDRDRRDREEQGSRGEHREAGARRTRTRDRSDTPPTVARERRGDTTPAAPRLRAGRHHRNGLLTTLPAEQRRLAEFVLRGGVPAVRQVIERQHTWADAEHQPRLAAEPLLRLAERLLPQVKLMEWRDRAEAALAQVDEVDLRDLRSVVSASDSAARNEEDRALAEQLRTALTARVDREHRAWLDELAGALADGRIVRALRLSSRPPKAGAPLPADLAGRLAELATAGLTSEVTQDRFATLLEAVSFSPVARRVAATSLPAHPSHELARTVRRVGDRVPAVAAQFKALQVGAPATPAGGEVTTPL